jgi:polyisoprenoid-binding protein YceI
MKLHTLFAALVVTAVSLPAFAADTMKIDPNHTYPNFTINHLGFSTMHGRFGSTSGTIVMDQKGNTSSVEVKIVAASIDTGFQKRDDHLRSPDFLNVKEFPEITYKSTKVVFKDAATATVEGNLTMAGVSKPVTLQVNNIKCGPNPFDKKETCGFNGSAKIKRSDWGVKYGLPAVGDDMEIMLEVEAIKG